MSCCVKLVVASKRALATKYNNPCMEQLRAAKGRECLEAAYVNFENWGIEENSDWSANFCEICPMGMFRATNIQKNGDNYLAASRDSRGFQTFKLIFK